MPNSHTLRPFLINRAGRRALATAGLLVFTLGTYMQLQADIGLPAWNALTQGLSMTLPFLSFGTVSIFISLAVVGLDLLLREPIGLGTILDALVVGWGLDFLLWLDLLPLQTQFLPQIVLLMLGLIITCVGQVIYMRAALSCGPRDALMVALGKRVTRIPIGVVNIVISCAVLVVGIFLGSRPGVGTVICLFGLGAMMELVFRLMRFEPRAVNHEGLTQTIAAWAAAARPQPSAQGDVAPDAGQECEESTL